jgi:hypothetical protein
MGRRVLGVLEGGAAHGMMIELDGPHWAPRGAVTVEVEGRHVVYVLARQVRPSDGEPWRYVPEGSSKAAYRNEEYDLGPQDPHDD